MQKVGELKEKTLAYATNPNRDLLGNICQSAWSLNYLLQLADFRVPVLPCERLG